MNKLLIGSGVFGAVLSIALWLAAVGATIYGLVLAFQAAVWLGVVGLLVSATGAPLVVGVVALFGGPDLAQALVNAIS